MAKENVQLAFCGAGNIGRGISKNLATKGDLTKPLILYNRTSSKAYDLQQTLPPGSCRVVESLDQVVHESDIIFTCLADDHAVEGLYDTIVKLDIANKLFVDCTTIHPESTEAVAKRLVDRGAAFVAMPVFGAPEAAENGVLLTVLAGPKKDVDRIKPYTTGVIAKGIIDMSDQPYGKASKLKVVGNSVILGMVESLSESLVLAEKTGLGHEAFAGFIDSIFGGVYSKYLQRMANGSYYQREEPLFAVDLAIKDARHAGELARSAKVPMPNLDAAEKHLHSVKAHAGKSGDISSIYGIVRKESGLPYENK